MPSPQSDSPSIPLLEPPSGEIAAKKGLPWLWMLLVAIIAVAIVVGIYEIGVLPRLRNEEKEKDDEYNALLNERNGNKYYNTPTPSYTRPALLSNSQSTTMMPR